MRGFALELLLIVGLMTGDMMRTELSVFSTILGTAVSAALVGGGVLLAASGPLGLVAATVIATAAVTVALVIAIRQLRKQSAIAVDLGRQVRAEYESQSSG